MNARRFSSSRQRGSVIVFAALGLSLMVILLSISDIGFLYFYKREYQKAADLAAMAGAKSLINASGIRSCAGNATPAAQVNAAQNLGSKSYVLVVSCGRWDPGATPRLNAAVPAEQQDAVQAVISGTPPRFLPFLSATTISASAIALADQPIAQLKIRSTVATLNDGAVNALLSGLLGGNAAVNVAGWQGVANADVNLLQFLNNVGGINVDADIGTYQNLLNASNVSIGQIIDAAVVAMGSGSAAAVTLQTFKAQLTTVGVNVNTLTVPLGDLLVLQSGAQTSGLNSVVNVFDLVRAAIEVANKSHAIAATAPIDLPGIAGVQVRAQVIEPTQLSAIGNPNLVDRPGHNPEFGPDRIFVRTAQVRTLISVTLPINGAVKTTLEGLLNNDVVTGIAGAADTLLGNVLNLNLVGLLQQLLDLCVLACNVERDVIDIKVLPTPRVDVNIDAGGGQAYVADHSCDSQKTLQVPIRTAAATIRVGNMGATAGEAATNVFASSAAPAVKAVPLLDVGSYHGKRQCLAVVLGVPVGCSTTWRKADGTYDANKNLAQRTAVSGIGIKIENFDVAGHSSTHSYQQPPLEGLPNVGEEPAWYTVTSTQTVASSLASSINNISIQFYSASGVGGGLGSVLILVGGVANTLVSSLSDIVKTALTPLLNPLIGFLASSLGLDINQVDVGANLSCGGGGATLVN